MNTSINKEHMVTPYQDTIYTTEQGEINRRQDVLSALISSDQDMYIPSSVDTYYMTYTSKGALTGEDSVLSDKESAALPERYNSFKSCFHYYQGTRISMYDFIQTAVNTGAITLDESKPVGYNISNAEEALMYSKATALYDWSTTLYSEDRMYVYRVENGQITGAHRAYFDDGTTFQDIADEIAGGAFLYELDSIKIDVLRRYDSELFDAAMNIGMAKRCYDTSEQMYRNGELTEKQFRHDCYPLMLLLFGERADEMGQTGFSRVCDFFEQDSEDFLKNAFAGYRPANHALVDKLLDGNHWHSYSGFY